MRTSVRTITCFGDSTICGYGDHDRYRGWAGQLEAHYYRLNEVEGIEYGSLPAFYRLGILGETALKLNDRIDSELLVRRRPRGGEVLNIISTGLNDSMVRTDGTELATIEAFADCMKDMTQRLVAKGDPLLYVGFTNFDQEKTTQFRRRDTVFDRDRAQEFETTAAKIVADVGGSAVPLFAASRTAEFESTMIDTDGLHPNLQGHQWIFERVLPYAEALMA